MPAKHPIDERLRKEARKFAGDRTEKTAITEANILTLFGTVEYDAKYDSKQQRRKS